LRASGNGFKFSIFEALERNTAGISKVRLQMQLFSNKLVIKVLKSKLFVWSAVPVLIAGIIMLAYFSGIKDFPVFPNNRIFDYHTYDDAGAGGNSKIMAKFVTDSLIKLDFQVGNQISNPYVELNIASKDGKTINLEHYNELKIKLNGNELNGISLALITENSLIKSDGQSQGVLFYQSFNISPGTKTYTINLENFKVPDWWSEYNRVENASSIQPDLKNLKALNVSCAYAPSIDKTHSIDIYSMAFSRNNKPVFMLITALVLLFVVIVFIVVYMIEKIRTNRKVITIAYKPVENNTTENSKSDFIVFINNNFQNCDLTLDVVSGGTGVSQRKITNEIQNRFGCNFKTYINRLRINESKRLLVNKELNIGEIAFKVGFNNQSHFNRVFKAEFQISPTEFRDKIRE
jgi:AraC-like DNA-binding protein